MTNDASTLKAMNIREILQTLPHRYPFLLIDRVISCTPGETITAIKNVSINEPFFQGHFAGRPVMPGVLIIEAMAQAGGILSGKAAHAPACLPRSASCPQAAWIGGRVGRTVD